MSGEAYAAAGSLLLALFGALGLVVRYVALELQKRIEATKRELEKNTELTKEVHKATNGRLASAIDRLQVATIERDNYRDMIGYVKRDPHGKRLLSEFAERRRVRVRDPELESLLAMQLPEERRGREG